MAFNYSGLQNTASGLIRKFGGMFAYTVRVTGTYDPATRTQAGADSVKSVKAVILRPGQALAEGAVKGFTSGTVVPKDRVQALIDVKGLSFVPKQGDVMTVGGVELFVDTFKPINPSELKAVIYIVVLKAGE